MSNSKNKNIYRIQYYNQNNIYELYARKISQDYLYAFLEVEDIIFGERSELLVDPSEEKLKAEFAGVKRTYIPLQTIIRIDEVDKEGANKIIATDGKHGTVAHFPSPFMPTHRPGKE